MRQRLILHGLLNPENDDITSFETLGTIHPLTQWYPRWLESLAESHILHSNFMLVIYNLLIFDYFLTTITSGNMKIRPPIIYQKIYLQLQSNLHISGIHTLQNFRLIFHSLIYYQYILSTFAWDMLCWLHRILCWSTAQPVNEVIFTTLKMTDTSEWANMFGIFKYASQAYVYLCWTGTFYSMKFDHNSPPSMYIHNTCHFAPQLSTLERKKIGGITFILTFVQQSLIPQCIYGQIL